MMENHKIRSFFAYFCFLSIFESFSVIKTKKDKIYSKTPLLEEASRNFCSSNNAVTSGRFGDCKVFRSTIKTIIIARELVKNLKKNYL